MPRKKPFNPFYFMLIVVGGGFGLTAAAYGEMSMRAVNPTPESLAIDGTHPLWAALHQWGAQAMIVELVLLGVATAAAIGTDEYWTRRNQ